MQSGDGLLVRFRPLGDIPSSLLTSIAGAAARHGNGVIEITTRGNLQVRGLSAQSAEAFARDVEGVGHALEIAPAVETSPLADLDPAERASPMPLTRLLRKALADWPERTKLAAKLSIIVDGCGSISLDASPADIRLKAHAVERWQLFIAARDGGERSLGTFQEFQVPDAIGRVLDALMTLGSNKRACDLAEIKGLEVGPVQHAAPARRLDTIGSHLLRNGTFALGIAPAFGQTDAAAIATLAESAGQWGVSRFRLGPGHSLLALDLSPRDALGFRNLADSLGFITNPADFRARIAACAGSSGCASGWFDTKAVAYRLASLEGIWTDAATSVHVSGCAKGCASPRPSTLSLTGQHEGIGVALDARAGQCILAVLAPDRIDAGIARLVALCRDNRLPGEPLEDCLARLGARQIASALGSA